MYFSKKVVSQFLAAAALLFLPAKMLRADNADSKASYTAAIRHLDYATSPVRLVVSGDGYSTMTTELADRAARVRVELPTISPPAARNEAQASVKIRASHKEERTKQAKSHFRLGRTSFSHRRHEVHLGGSRVIVETASQGQSVAAAPAPSPSLPVNAKVPRVDLALGAEPLPPALKSVQTIDPVVLSLLYGDHTCNLPGCTDRRGQIEQYGFMVQNIFNVQGLYAGAIGQMMTPQQYKGETSAAWKDTAEAYLTLGQERHTKWGTLTFGGKVGQINGAAFKYLSDLNKFEHDSIDGAAPGTTRVESPSSKGQLLLGGFESAVVKVASTKVWGFDVNANLAQYANIGTALNSLGGGPVVSIGSADHVPLPGGPALQGKGFSLSAGVIFDGVINDVSVKKINHTQAHAVVSLNVPVGRWMVSAELEKPFTPQTKHGVGGPQMSQFGIRASLSF